MTLTRKMALLATMATMALAFAIPASASAYTWTVDWYQEGPVSMEAEETAWQSYEGNFGFSLGSQGGFSCETTIEIEAEGPSAGKIIDFIRNPSECQGTGNYANCVLEGESNNVASGWNIDVGLPSPMVTGSGSGLEVHDDYDYEQDCPFPGRTIRLSSLELVPTLNEQGMITQFTLEGWETNGAVHDVFGPFAPVGGTPILGLE